MPDANCITTPCSCYAAEERVYSLPMCDNDSFDDMVAYRLRRELLSRRNFASLSLGPGLVSLLPAACKSADSAQGTAASPSPSPSAAAALPSPPDAVATTDSEVVITTPDGACDAYFVHPT